MDYLATFILRNQIRLEISKSLIIYGDNFDIYIFIYSPFTSYSLFINSQLLLYNFNQYYLLGF